MIKKSLNLIGLVCILSFLTTPGLAEDMLEGPLDGGVYKSADTLTAGGDCTVPAGEGVTFEGLFAVVLKPNFKVETGGRLTITIPDNDGLSNRCEMLYFGHLDYGPQDDPDIDWLDNYTECTLDTNPNLYDMDNDDDQMPDWWEVQYFGYTLANQPNEDADGDGVTNYVEWKLNANPTANDLPGPGLHYEYDALGRIKRIYRIPQQ